MRITYQEAKAAAARVRNYLQLQDAARDAGTVRPGQPDSLSHELSPRTSDALDVELFLRAAEEHLAGTAAFEVPEP